MQIYLQRLQGEQRINAHKIKITEYQVFDIHLGIARKQRSLWILLAWKGFRQQDKNEVKVEAFAEDNKDKEGPHSVKSNTIIFF